MQPEHLPFREALRPDEADVLAAITSSVPARTRRISRPSLNSDRFNAGSSRYFQPSAVNTLRPSGPTGPRPPDGSQRISTEKNRISSSPPQKVGTEKPTTEKAMIARLERASGR